jgi:integrase
MFAREWYGQAEREHRAHATAVKAPPTATWDDICDAYLTEVSARMRGKAATRHEAMAVTNANIRNGILASGKPSDNDENRCLVWLRALASEDIARPGKPKRVRKPTTVRNIAKHLRYLFKVALRSKLIPGLTLNPTRGEEFTDELKGVVAQVERRDWLLPVESFMKLVTCARVPANRRISYLVLGLTGLRPGELGGLQLRHLMRDGQVRFLTVEQQLTQPRGKAVKAAIDTPKTKWGHRSVALHPALVAPLDEWVASGWAAWVGRQPTPEDYVFSDSKGVPHRDHDGDILRRDLEAAGCPTAFEGKPLSVYALRHLFSTLLMESHAQDAAHDRMMGHRPKDTKTLNYSAKLVSFLAVEIARIPFELPADAPSFGGPLVAVPAPAEGAGEEVVRDAPA